MRKLLSLVTAVLLLAAPACVTNGMPASTEESAVPPTCAELAARPDLWRGTEPPLPLAFNADSLEQVRRRVVGQAIESAAPIARTGPEESAPVAFCVHHDGGQLVFASSALGGWSLLTDLTVAREPPTPTQSCAPGLLVSLPPIDELLASGEALLTARWGTPEAAPDQPGTFLWTRRNACRCDDGGRRCARLVGLRGGFADGRTERLTWRAMLETL